MNTLEIAIAITKGSEKAGISEKQRTWFLSVAKKEGVKSHFDGFNTHVLFDTFYYTVRQARRLASGGSYVGTKAVQGRFVMEKEYVIRFSDTGITRVSSQTDIEHFRREGHQFEIINPIAIFSTAA